MASLNVCMFIGNLGADPEIRSFQDGGKIANFRIAATEKYKDRNNQPQENTEWIPCVLRGPIVDLIAPYLKKGTSVFVDGKWHNREWQDQQGGKHYQTELNVRTIQLLGPKPQQQNQQQGYAPAPVYAPAPGYAPAPQYQQPAQPQYQQAPQGGYPPQAPAPQAPAPQAQQAPAQQPAAQPQGAYPPMNSPEYTGQGADDLPF